MDPYSQPMMPPMGQPAPPQDDFLGKVMKDPWFRLGMALLEQGGPQDKPHSVGQDISRAVGFVQADDDRRMMSEQQRRQMAQQQQAQRMAMDQMQQLSSPQGAPGGPPQEMPGAPTPLTPPNVSNMIAPGASRIPQAQPAAGGRLQVPPEYEQIIRQAAQMYGVPYELLAAQAQKESSWNPMAKGTSGELGLSQFMPKTGTEYGLIRDGKDLRSDPRASIMAQARFMKDLAQRNDGDWFKATHQYNASPDNPMGQQYAASVFGIAGMPVPGGMGGAPQAAGDQPGPLPQAPIARPVALPPELKRMFLSQAYAEGGYDPVKTMSVYNRLVNEWTTEQMKQSTQFGNQRDLETYKNDLTSQEARRKAQQELDMAGPKKFNEELAKTFNEAYTQIYKTGNAARSKIDRLNVLEQSLGKAYTGAGGSTVKQLTAVAASLGIEGFEEGAAAADIADAIINQMALSFRSTANGEGMPGAMSDADRAFLMSIPPGFEKTKLGNKILIDFMKRTARREQEIARLAREYRVKNKGQFDDGFDVELDAWAQKTPMYKPGELQKLFGVKINPDHIKTLQANPTPETIKMFNTQYGAGTAESYLGGR